MATDKPQPTDFEQLVRDVSHEMFFSAAHPIVREGVRHGVPKLLEAVTSMKDLKALLAAWKKVNA